MAAAVFAFSLPSFRVMCVRLLASSRTRHNRGNSSSGGISGGSNQLDSGGRKSHAGRGVGILDGKGNGKGNGSLATTWTIGGGVVDRNGVRRSRAPQRLKNVDDDMDFHDPVDEQGVVVENLEMGDISMDISMEIDDGGCGSSAEGGSGLLHGNSDWKESQERLRPGSTETMSTGPDCNNAVSMLPRVETYLGSARLETRELGQLVEFDFFPEMGATASHVYRHGHGDISQHPPHV